MSDVKRYVPVDQWGQDMPKCMVADENGSYVRASDYDALRAELAALKAANGDLQLHFDVIKSDYDALKAAARKVTCRKCHWKYGGPDRGKCPDCADLRALLGSET